MADQRNHFIRFLGYVKPYWVMLAFASLGGVVKFTLPLLAPIAIQHLLDHVLLNPALPTERKMHEVLFYLGGMSLLFVVVYIPWVYVRHYYAGKAGHRSVFDLRCDLYHQILRMSASYFSRNKSGSIVSRLMGDTLLAQNLVGAALTNVWMDGVSLIFILWILFHYDAGTAWVALATVPFYIFCFKYFGGRIKQVTLQVQEEIALMSGNANEKISGSLVVHAFTQEKREHQRFHQESDRLFATTMTTNYLQSLNITLTSALLGIAPLVVTIYAAWRVVQGHMTIGEMVAVGAYLAPLYVPFQRFSELNVIFANSMAALDRIFEIMDAKPEIVDAPDAVHIETMEGRVEFHKVDFRYPEGEMVLHDLSLTVDPGERVALVGPSGSGKSTLVSLIPRFYDVAGGGVLIDGHDVRHIKLETLRRNIGMVLQDAVLFSGRLRDNILYGRPHAGEEELLEACRAANALGFIEQLPHGFETEVGERGVFLSGGQKQRLTIARAFLLNPRILILDEPTSALDAESERLIQDALARLMQGRTTFIIAHRLSTITSADQILVLEHGHVVERGRHVDLLRHGGLYRTLYEQQFSSARASIELLDDLRAG